MAPTIIPRFGCGAFAEALGADDSASVRAASPWPEDDMALVETFHDILRATARGKRASARSSPTNLVPAVRELAKIDGLARFSRNLVAARGAVSSPRTSRPTSPTPETERTLLDAHAGDGRAAAIGLAASSAAPATRFMASSTAPRDTPVSAEPIPPLTVSRCPSGIDGEPQSTSTIAALR